MLKISTYRARLTRLVTPQAERNPGTRLLVRSAKAPAWPANEWERFDRFLIFGSERGTYFMRQRMLTADQASNAQACIAADGPRAVRRIVEVSVLGRVMSNHTCLFALALCAALGNEATRTMALDAVPEVARDADEARLFAQYLEVMRGGGPDAMQGIQRDSGRGAVALIYAAVPHTLPSRKSGSESNGIDSLRPPRSSFGPVRL
jgi:60 kDa SS-A/Ro ribonucleoprotein